MPPGEGPRERPGYLPSWATKCACGLPWVNLVRGFFYPGKQPGSIRDWNSPTGAAAPQSVQVAAFRGSRRAFLLSRFADRIVKVSVQYSTLEFILADCCWWQGYVSICLLVVISNSIAHSYSGCEGNRGKMEIEPLLLLNLQSRIPLRRLQLN